MFKDYYAILEIDVTASQEDIKAAFKKQALKWHPDRNIGKDTASIMQDINEAKLILLDIEARERYNKEYHRFKDFQRQRENENRQKEKQREEQKNQKKGEEQKQYKEKTSQARDYEVEDEILNKWMNNAKKQAVDLAKETIEDLKGMTKEGMKAASEKVGSQIPSLLIMALIFLIIALSIKNCNT
jgi:curved DNA-binding protein CbpA